MEGINSIILPTVFELPWNHRMSCIRRTLKDHPVPTPAMILSHLM